MELETTAQRFAFGFLALVFMLIICILFIVIDWTLELWEDGKRVKAIIAILIIAGLVIAGAIKCLTL